MKQLHQIYIIWLKNHLALKKPASWLSTNRVRGVDNNCNLCKITLRLIHEKYCMQYGLITENKKESNY